MSLGYISDEVVAEVDRACGKFPAFHSAHEGYAVILEELDELWMECKSNPPDVAQMREEAIQVAAMAMRFVLDLCDVVVVADGAAE